MGFLGRLFHKLQKEKEEYEDGYDAQDQKVTIIRRKEINMHDANQRNHYIENCVEQAKEAEEELSRLSFEYKMVTAYLKDMEEILV